MLKHRILLLALPLLAWSVVVSSADSEIRTEGDVLIIQEHVNPGMAKRDARPETRVPTRGMNKENVRNIFGEPAREHAPVGDPPITRWDYADYSVFFEYDKVLHSVITE